MAEYDEDTLAAAAVCLVADMAAVVGRKDLTKVVKTAIEANRSALEARGAGERGATQLAAGGAWIETADMARSLVNKLNGSRKQAATVICYAAQVALSPWWDFGPGMSGYNTRDFGFAVARSKGLPVCAQAALLLGVPEQNWDVFVTLLDDGYMLADAIDAACELHEWDTNRP